jgi:succinate dehydrogenase/fumarate reductase flavoprotein subunit
VIDRLLANGIDLTKTPVEVGPMAHYHMGGIRVDANMRSRVEGLYAAGEAVGGANGANRLSGNAITEAFVFGARAGEVAAEEAKGAQPEWNENLAGAALERLEAFRSSSRGDGTPPIALQNELQKLMWEQAGPFRTGEKLTTALSRIQEMQRKDLLEVRIGSARRFNVDLHDALELRAMLLTAEALVRSGLSRPESRGAHQREDFPNTDNRCLKNQVVALQEGGLQTHWIAPIRIDRARIPHG